MQEIELSNGHKVVVDDDAFDYLSQWKWYATGKYAIRRGGILMHREIMQPPKNLQVDHINGDTKDNRRQNLRLCTAGQNRMNRRTHARNNRSGYKGVFWEKRKRRWMAQLRYQTRKVFGGYFKDVTDAARAYDRMAIKYFGEFARINGC